jgi:hypothetical protein
MPAMPLNDAHFGGFLRHKPAGLYVKDSFQR